LQKYYLSLEGEFGLQSMERNSTTDCQSTLIGRRIITDIVEESSQTSNLIVMEASFWSKMAMGIPDNHVSKRS
jgi:hypothetical protein